MPTYEYECNKGHQFEVQQRITEPPLERCEVCSSKVRRLISASTFILKGSGWYSDGYSGAGSSSGSTDGAKSSSESGSGDSKPSSSKETKSTSSSAGSSD